MMKYLCLFLAVAAFALGWLYYGASGELATTKTNLATAVATNKANDEAIARLERSIENTENVLAEWNEDRTTLAGIRSATRQAIKEAMRDETFKTWASGAVPDDAWRLLSPTNIDADRSAAAGTAAGTAGRLPGVRSPDQRFQW